MVKIFGRNAAKEKEDRDYRRSLVALHAAKTGTVPSQQQVNSMGRAYFLQEDEHVVSIIEKHCPELLPAFSRLNATSKIDKPRDREQLELMFQDVLLHEEMDLGDEGSMVQRSLIKSLGINAKFRILDAQGGYRGQLITTEVEKSTHVIEEPQKKKIL